MSIQQLEIDHDLETGEIKIYRKGYDDGLPSLTLLVETSSKDHALLALRSILLNP